ncbi:helix-turn-helix transcriptional regulator [Streptomyces sp. NBRC 109706]|uniref:helix-turn-helix domain-containing protein n=1 Tax=Streptomyces sp. NBRC 109706 TaxID=1550035 RepID=UPI001F2C6AE1|nr:helix-turn-helix transcriptional regulator [Streptomyces sp. NBRC 109706]
MDNRTAKRANYPLTIPDALLQSEPMQRACATRDFAEIFRLVNRRTGTSQADMAAAIGKMTSSRVSDIIRGTRGIRGTHVIERIADAFGIPGEMLGVSAQAWESSPAGSPDGGDILYVDKSREAAGSHDTAPTTEEELSPELPEMLLASVWIEGKEQVVAIRRRDLSAGAASLMAASTSDNSQMSSVARGRSGGIEVHKDSKPSVPGFGQAGLPTMPGPPDLGISPFEGMTLQQSGEHLLKTFLHLDDEMGGDSLYLPLSRYVARMAVSVRENAKDGLQAFGQLNQMAGWLALDASSHAAAHRHFDMAVGVGAEVRDHGLKASALAYRSLQETYRGEHSAALTLAQEAVTLQHENLSPLTRTMLGTRLARAHAGLGDKAACLKSLESMRNDYQQAGSHEEPQYVSYVDSIEVAAQEGACYLDLGMTQHAVTSLTSAIGLLSIHAPNRVRDRVHYLSRLAKCYTLDGEIEEACRTGSYALKLSGTIGSARVTERLGELAKSLTPHARVASVVDFQEQYRMATQG